MQDVECVLADFQVIAAPVWDEAHQNWTCKIKGLDTEREPLSLVVGVSAEDKIIVVITGY